LIGESVLVEDAEFCVLLRERMDDITRISGTSDYGTGPRKCCCTAGRGKLKLDEEVWMERGKREPYLGAVAASLIYHILKNARLLSCSLAITG
jgi:hypothetical protein